MNKKQVYSAYTLSFWTEDYIKTWWKKEATSLIATANSLNFRIEYLRNDLKRTLKNITGLEAQVGNRKVHSLVHYRWIAREETRNGGTAAYRLAYERDKLLHIQFELLLKSPSKRNFQLDLDHLFGLNLSAARLWKSMLDCRSGNAEEARRLYLTGQWTCLIGSNISAKDIVAQISGLIGNATNLIRIGGFLPVDFKKINPTKLSVFNAWADFHESEASHNSVVNSTPKMPAAHPLFVQALLQAVIEVMHINKSWSSKQFDNHLNTNTQMDPQKILRNVANFFNSISIGNCRPIGLWPSANEAILRALTNRQMERHLLVDKGWLKAQIMDSRSLPISCKSKKLPSIYYDKKIELTVEVNKNYRQYNK